MMYVYPGLSYNINYNDTLEEILSKVSFVCKVSKKDILGKSRNANIIIARHFYFYFAKTVTDELIMNIGKHINKTHGTVISAIKKINKYLEVKDKVYTSIYDKLCPLNMISIDRLVKQGIEPKEISSRINLIYLFADMQEMMIEELESILKSKGLFSFEDKKNISQIKKSAKSLRIEGTKTLSDDSSLQFGIRSDKLLDMIKEIMNNK